MVSTLSQEHFLFINFTFAQFHLSFKLSSKEFKLHKYFNEIRATLYVDIYFCIVILFIFIIQ